MVSVLANVVICSGWFLSTTLFYQRSSSEFKQRELEFFARMKTPILEHVEHREGDRRQRVMLGNLCLVYGGLIMLMTLIPNPVEGRLCLLFCGGVVAATGWCLRASRA